MDEEAIVRKFQKELNAGTASLVVLGLMDRLAEPLYGYQIAKLLESLAGGRLPMKQGALYPVLRSMEAKGLLESEVVPSSSAPPRKYYRVTEDGRSMLGRWVAVWGDTREFIDRALTGAPGPAGQDEETADV